MERVHRPAFNTRAGRGSVKWEKKSSRSKGFRGPCLHRAFGQRMENSRWTL